MFKKRVRKSGPFTKWELKKIKRSFELRKLEGNLFLSYKNHEKKKDSTIEQSLAVLVNI